MEDTGYREKIEEALRTAKAKMLMKPALLVLACIIAAVLAGASGFGTAVVILPLLVALLPAGMGVYYFILFRKGKMGMTVAVITDRRRDIAGGLISGMSLSHRKYCFEYTAEDGGTEAFHVSRSGWFNSYAPGQAYLCLHSKSKPLGSDNFYEAVLLGSVKDNGKNG